MTTGLSIDGLNAVGLALDDVDRDGCASMAQRLRRMHHRAPDADPDGLLLALSDDLELLATPLGAAVKE